MQEVWRKIITVDLIFCILWINIVEGKVLAIKLLRTDIFLVWIYDIIFNILHKTNSEDCRKLFHIMIEKDVLCQGQIKKCLIQNL